MPHDLRTAESASGAAIVHLSLPFIPAEACLGRKHGSEQRSLSMEAKRLMQEPVSVSV